MNRGDHTGRTRRPSRVPLPPFVAPRSGYGDNLLLLGTDLGVASPQPISPDRAEGDEDRGVEASGASSSGGGQRGRPLKALHGKLQRLVRRRPAGGEEGAHDDVYGEMVELAGALDPLAPTTEDMARLRQREEAAESMEALARRLRVDIKIDTEASSRQRGAAAREPPVLTQLPPAPPPLPPSRPRRPGTRSRARAAMRPPWCPPLPSSTTSSPRRRGPPWRLAVSLRTSAQSLRRGGTWCRLWMGQPR